MAALVVGAMFGIWLGFDPRGLTASAYVEQQQTAIRALNVVMPVLGAIAIALTIGQAWLVRSSRVSFRLLLSGAVLLMAAGLITRFGNQPINARVITWNAVAPPTVWIEARDEWWHFHVLRTIAGLAALACIIAGSISAQATESTGNRPPG
jgi:Domain of unknown function (DUF1772).